MGFSGERLERVRDAGREEAEMKSDDQHAIEKKMIRLLQGEISEGEAHELRDRIVADASLSARFQKLERAAEVAFQVRPGIFDRIADASLRRQVDDKIRLFGPEQRHQQFRCLDPVVDCLEMLVLQQHLLPALLQPDIIVVRHRIKADDPETVLQQTRAEEKSDEPCRAGYQYGFHVRPSSFS